MEKKQTERRLRNRAEVAQIVVALAVLLLGLSVIVGWHIGIAPLVRVRNSFAPMAYNTALGFILCGVVWLCQSFDKRRLALIGGALVLALGLFTLLEYVAGISLGKDELLMTHVIKGERILSGRMAPNTALNFALSGLSLLVYGLGALNTKRAAVVGILGAVVTALGSVALVGYLVNLPTAYGWGHFSGMAVHTSVGFILLGGITIVRAWREGAADSETAPRWLATLACIGAVTATICLWQALSAQRFETTQHTVNSRAQDLQHGIEIALRERMLALQRMAERWTASGEEGTPYIQWQADARNYIRDFKGFQALGLVDSTNHVRWVEPLAGNEAAINWNLAEDEQRRTSIETARDTRASSFTRTVKLVTGSDGVVLFVPLYRQDICQGYLSSSFRIDNLLNAILPQEIKDDFAVKVSDGAQAIYQYGSVAQQTPWSEEYAVYLNGISWQIRIAPQPHIAASISSRTPEVVLVTGLLVSLLLGWSMFLGQRAQERARETTKVNGELEREVAVRTQTEARLRGSEERYRSLVDNSLGLICTHDMEGHLLSINPAAARALGYQADELVGRKIQEVIMPAHQAQMDWYLRRAGESETMSGLMHIMTRAGEERVWAYNNTYCGVEAGKAPYMLGYAQDVTELKRVENELRETSSQLREAMTLQQAIFNSANYTIIATDVDGTIRTFNRAAQTKLGYTSEEVIGKQTPAIIHDPAEVVQRSQELTAELGRVVEPGFEVFVAKARTGIVDENEWTYIHKDGKRFPALLSITGLQDDEGRITGFLGIGSDITERKRAEKELAAREALLQQFIAHTPAAIAVLDNEMRYLQVSEHWLRDYHLLGQEIIGRSHYEIFPDVPESWKEIHRRVLAGAIERCDEDPFPRADGTTEWLQWEAQPWQKADGEIGGLIFFTQVITQRKQIEESLRESEQRNRLLVAGVKDYAIFMLDPLGHITSWNEGAERIKGYKAEEIIGKHFSIFYPEADVLAGKTERELEIATTEGQYEEEEWRIRSDGSRFFAHVSISAVRDEAGKLRGFSKVTRDITKRKQMEEELKRAHDAALESARLKSEFLANMSHEIRTPMNGVVGMTGLLLATDLNVRQQDYAENIQSSADALLTIIDDILDFSKIEAGLLRFEEIDFDLRGAVEAPVELLAERAQAKGLELASLIYRDVPTALQGDPGRLRQVLTNLIGNAVKFTERGEVMVSVTQVSKTESHTLLRFEIKDTGIGISPEAQRRLFRAFTQADGSTTRKYGGTGLGLVISKQLVELMGGEIGIESAPGVGSTFWFTGRFKKQAKPPKAEKKIDMASLLGVRVLIVDDNTTNREILVHQTGSWGMIATEAESGARALELLRTDAARGAPYEIALLDLMMPGMDGFQLADAIKSDPLIAQVSLVLLPSYGKRGDGETARKAGIAAYLQKPVRQSHLYNCLIEITSQSSRIETATPSRLVTRHSLHETKVMRREHGAHSTVRLLIAEDNLVNQMVALNQLENLGYQAEVVANGREALNALDKKHYDIILMDCQMPEMDGFEATSEIRQREGADRHTTIIAITANALGGDREKCLAAGMDDYLSKPVRQEVLSLKLEQWIKPVKGAVVKREQPLQDGVALSGKQLSVGSLHLKSDSVSGVDLSVLNAYRKIQRPGKPDFVTALIDLFLKETETQLKVLHEAVSRYDAGELRRVAHLLKGSSGNIGAERMATLAEELEGKGVEEEEAEALFTALEHEFGQVREALEAERIAQ